MSPNDNGGRVTTREFYDALLDQNKERAAMESRLGDKIDDIHSDIATNNEKLSAMGKSYVVINKRVDTNTADIKTNAKNLKIVGGIEAALLMLGGWLGFRQ